MGLRVCVAAYVGESACDVTINALCNRPGLLIMHMHTSLALSSSFCLHVLLYNIYIYIYIYMCVCVCVYS